MARQYKKRDKIVHKITHDGLVARNAVTGEETRVSQRGQDFNVKQGEQRRDTADGRESNAGQRPKTQPVMEETPEGQDFGKSPAPATGATTDVEKQPRKAGRESNSGSQQDTQRRKQHGSRYIREQSESPAQNMRGPEPHEEMNSGRDGQKNEPEGSIHKDKAPEQPGKLRFSKKRTKGAHGRKSRQHSAAYTQKFAADPVKSDESGETPVQAEKPRSGKGQAKDVSGKKPRQRGTAYTQGFTTDTAKQKTDAAPGAAATEPEKPVKLQFTADEQTPVNKKLSRLQGKAEKTERKLEQAREKLPTRRRARLEKTTDAETGKTKRRLRFEKEVKSKRSHLKGPVPLRPVKAGVNAGVRYAHKKIHQVEDENVAVKAAHKGERLVEDMARKAYRSHKLKPYRTVRKLEKKTVKANVKYAYRKALRDNPQLRSNLLSRMMQKRKIKRQYAKAAREARRAAEGARSVGTVAVRAVKAVSGFVRSHPALVGAVLGIALLIFMMFALLSSCSNMAGGGLSAVVLSSYTAEDADILAVEDTYLQMEAALQAKIDGIESEYPGYDEYRYSLAEIGHDPYELASYLTAKYFDYTPDEVQAELEIIFTQQYALTIAEEAETRYRAEIRTNSDGSTYTVQVPYEYRILHVTLENRSLGSIAAENLDADQLELYGLYMETKGNKEYLFEDSNYAYNSTPAGDYADYEIPPDALSDPQFAALIAEAEKYLGYPYVWGGSKPSTSFDCSGFICWVLNQSGTASVGRTSAQGIYNQCTPVSASEAKPGDLIFFTKTYKTDRAVTHIGIYVGNGMMIHCGNPIQYTSINTNYWKEHFYGYGRLSG